LTFSVSAVVWDFVGLALVPAVVLTVPEKARGAALTSRTVFDLLTPAEVVQPSVMYAEGPDFTVLPTDTFVPYAFPV
jgi:hypothetical protein